MFKILKIITIIVCFLGALFAGLSFNWLAMIWAICAGIWCWTSYIQDKIIELMKELYE
jgi:hypothetical protein